MLKKTLFLTLLVLLLVSSASAFNGERQGFVLGGGLGFAPMAKMSLDDFEEDESNSGFGLNFIIGYAWDEYNMIVYEGNVCSYTSSEILNDLTVAQGFNGASWYHYFGPSGMSFFTAVGIGFCVMEIEDYDETIDYKVGFLIGGGYEFTRHVQVGAYFSSGGTAVEGVDITNSHFSVLVSAVAF